MLTYYDYSTDPHGEDIPVGCFDDDGTDEDILASVAVLLGFHAERLRIVWCDDDDGELYLDDHKEPFGYVTAR